MTRLAVIAHRAHDRRSQRALHGALESCFEVTRVNVEDGWPTRLSDLPAVGDYDAVLFFVRFRELGLRPEFDWEGYRGLRLLLDFDINLNYHTLGETRYAGAWPPVLRRLDLDLVLTTGGEVAKLLRSEGIPAHWLPKGFDDTALRDLGGPRAGLCSYGHPYRSRRAMLDRLRRERVELTTFSSPYQQLNDVLNRFLGCVICNLGGSLRPGYWWRIANRIRPGLGLRLVPGIEPMIKNFEAAGAGCAPIVDHLDDLEALGFADGESMLCWHDFDDLIERCRWCLEHPEALAAIGARAHRLVHERHTWTHRAQEIRRLVQTRTAVPAGYGVS
jgi:hypothetical protein